MRLFYLYLVIISLTARAPQVPEALRLVNESCARYDFENLSQEIKEFLLR